MEGSKSRDIDKGFGDLQMPMSGQKVMEDTVTGEYGELLGKKIRKKNLRPLKIFPHT